MPKLRQFVSDNISIEQWDILCKAEITRETNYKRFEAKFDAVFSNPDLRRQITGRVRLFNDLFKQRAFVFTEGTFIQYPALIDFQSRDRLKLLETTFDDYQNDCLNDNHNTAGESLYHCHSNKYSQRYKGNVQITRVYYVDNWNGKGSPWKLQFIKPLPNGKKQKVTTGVYTELNEPKTYTTCSLRGQTPIQTASIFHSDWLIPHGLNEKEFDYYKHKIFQNKTINDGLYHTDHTNVFKCTATDTVRRQGGYHASDSIHYFNYICDKFYGAVNVDKC